MARRYANAPVLWPEPSAFRARADAVEAVEA
jgi:hypothetical protein